MPPTLAGKVCVITGATSGIGRVAAMRLAQMGARLVLVARDQARAEAMLARLPAQGGATAHRAHYADLSRIAEMKRVAAEIAAAEPRITLRAPFALASPTVTETGVQAAPCTPEEFRQRVEREIALYTRIADANGIRAE